MRTNLQRFSVIMATTVAVFVRMRVCLLGLTDELVCRLLSCPLHSSASLVDLLLCQTPPRPRLLLSRFFRRCGRSCPAGRQRGSTWSAETARTHPPSVLEWLSRCETFPTASCCLRVVVHTHKLFFTAGRWFISNQLFVRKHYLAGCHGTPKGL